MYQAQPIEGSTRYEVTQKLKCGRIIPIRSMELGPLVTWAAQQDETVQILPPAVMAPMMIIDLRAA